VTTITALYDDHCFAFVAASPSPTMQRHELRAAEWWPYFFKSVSTVRASGLAGLGALSVLLARLGGRPLVRTFLTVIASAVVLAGCAAQTTKGYVRTDGGSVDLAREQATLAQCKGEAAKSVPPPNSGAVYLDEARKENTLIVACMARNGYIIQTQ
jgi:hypothetical protein